MIFRPLLEEERVGAFGASHVAIITHEDLTETTADTDQVINIYTVADDISASITHAKVVDTFADLSDDDLNDTQMSAGDDDDADGFITAFQVNANGTAALVASRDGAYTDFMVDYAAANHLEVLVESMAGKSLSNIDAGEIHFFIRFLDNR